MSHGLQWTPYKKRYDLVLAGAITTYLIAFFTAGKLSWRGRHAISDEILLIRAFGTCAFAMLTFILCIGPLARIDRRFLPILYNRRHLGVTTFFIAAAHAILVLGYYHGFGTIGAVRSLLTSNTQYGSLSAFPFEIPGLAALAILLLMAATSHDFWLNALSSRVWKSLHMMVYVAWTLLVFHIVLGALQAEHNPAYLVLMAAAVLTVGLLHLVSGRREVRRDHQKLSGKWIEACAVDEIPEGQARVVAVSARERVAVFRYNDGFSAVGNVCAHQGGPLGEGRIIDGCITCPWHGYQYRPQDGCAPPPFTEKVPTYPVRVENGRVLVCMEEGHVAG
jgi:nitrite reductase/ring-hydroxylating ferredoxin subunit/DMSO/TMAO reductase YedYZ heme-binding membrane subunit